MSASDPPLDPTADTAWLIRGCLEVLRAGSDTERRRQAEHLGAQAAEQGMNQRDVVDAFLAAAIQRWPRPDTTGDALPVLRELVRAANDGFDARTRSELATHQSDRAEFVNDLLTGRTDPNALAERADRYGMRLPGAHTVIVARGDGITATLSHRIDAALSSRFGEGNTLTSLRGEDLVCISAGGLRGVPAELAHHLLAALGAGEWQIGVGRSHAGLRGVATSMNEARSALDLATRLGFTTPILQAADLLVFPVLLRDREAITDLVTTVLGPRAEARGGPAPYLQTLTVLFDNQGNYTATARDLHLSVRAVTYRLDRIRALTGYHPGEPTQRFTLHAAVLGARLLDWPPTRNTA